MEVEQLAISSLKPAPYNPRKISKHDMAALERSLAEFGAVDPAVVNQDGTIIGGHMRVEAAKRLGWTEFPSVRVDLDEDKARLLNLALNRISGEWDDDMLAELIWSLHEADADLLLSGFDDKELAKIVASVGPVAGDDEVPPAPTVPETRSGDVWVLGAHRLMCGDAFDQDSRQTLLGDKLADCVLTDPPFAIYGSSSGVSSSVADDKMVRPFFEQLGYSLAQSVEWFGHAYVCCDWRSYPTLWEGFKRSGLTPRNVLVWDKGGGGLGANWMNTHEFIGYFARLPEEKTMSGSRKAGVRAVNKPNMLRFSRPSGDEREHNAAKPVEMLSYIIEAATDEGGVVLDLFGGSGSTLVAAERTGRACRMMEMEPAWCDVIVHRWEKLTGEKARTEDGRTLPEPVPTSA